MLLVGAFLLPVDFSIVNVALPAIRDGLFASSGELQLVIALYAVAFAVLLITGGRLGDLLGRKAMFITGMAGFMLASAACGLAWSIHVLLAGRLLQGIAAALMSPQILASIPLVFPAAERSRALGYYGATAGFGIVVGQLLGGVLISLHPFGLTWETIFLVNLPVGALDLAAAAWLLPKVARSQGVRLDIPGVLVLTLGLALLVYPLVAGREAGWPQWTLWCLAASPPTLAAFVLIEYRLALRGGQPLFDVRLFANRTFSVGLGLSMMVYSSSAFFFSFAVYLQSGLHWDVLHAGLAVMPNAFGFLFGSLSVPRMVARFGNGAPMLGYGLGILGQGCVVALLLTGGGPGVVMFTGQAVAGLGLGLVFPSLLRIVLQDMAPTHAGMASGVLNTVIQLGPSLAVPIIGGVFFTVLGLSTDMVQYNHAFAAVLACIVATFLASLALIQLLRPSRG